ncbi:ribose-5-phosphate isomerase RpiA [Edaphobacter aggregans]|uniref:ribose-5-phosphate isomerase RpiA n=1 Tax=Edaphobacter aggregans TaxID=570835 RepID=UPI0005582F96|nr:ribose-5-phosphate isomerase RpiA [Edaphobacter aggregans]
MAMEKAEQDRLKMEVAERALALVKPGMMVGLGSGSTATMWIRLLGEKVQRGELKLGGAIASSEDSERLGRSYGIPFTNFEETKSLDLTVDGADEVAPGLALGFALIKGGGGKLLREKIVASASKRFVVVVDESKVVEKLGRFPLPVEVIPMAEPLVRRELEGIGFTPKVRGNKDGSQYITDEGNLILDCSGVMIEDPAAMAKKLDGIVGVVEHGLFLGYAEMVLIAGEGGVRERGR